MANAPSTRWSELGKPLGWMYTGLRLQDPDVPNVLAATEVLATVDAFQGGWGEQRHVSGMITGDVGLTSPFRLFGPANKLSGFGATLSLCTQSDLQTDTDGALLLGCSFFNSTAGALSVSVRIFTPYNIDSAAADAPLVAASAVAAAGEAILVGASTPYLFIPPMCSLIVAGLNVANTFFRFAFTRVRAGFAPNAR